MKHKLVLFNLCAFLLLFLVMQTVSAFSGNSTNYNIPMANINYAAYNGSSSNYKIEFSLTAQAVANATTNYTLYMGYFSPTALLEDGSSCTRNEECSSGYCVHSICRSATTYCGDDYCDSGESCSSCSADCGSCSGGDFPPEKAKEYDLGNLTTKGKNQSLALGENATFVINNVIYKVKATAINSTSISLLTDSINLTLGLNETKSIDLNKDGVNDVEITLNDIVKNKAHLTFKAITIAKPAICGNEVCEDNETQQSCCTDCGCPAGRECVNNACTKAKVQTKHLKIITIAILVLAALVIYYSALRKRKKR